MIKNNFTSLYQRLGYRFNDESLLKAALTHRSVGKENNERLEFLGDSILNFVAAKALFEKFPEAREGELSRLRAVLVKGETLAEIAKEKGLGDYLILGEGELKSGGFRRASILADSVEALIGAISLESGLDVAQACVLSWYHSRLENISLDVCAKDSKSKLQEWLQANKYPLPVYQLDKVEGQSHCQNFTVMCIVEKLGFKTEATGTNRRQAEKQAAQLMLDRVQEIAQ